MKASSVIKAIRIQDWDGYIEKRRKESMSEFNKLTIERFENGGAKRKAALMILEGAIDAPHHRQWYLDQAVRLLADIDYRNLINAFEEMSGVEWDTGIAP